MFLNIIVPVYLIWRENKLTHEKFAYFISVIFTEQELKKTLAAGRLHFIDVIVTFLQYFGILRFLVFVELHEQQCCVESVLVLKQVALLIRFKQLLEHLETEIRDTLFSLRTLERTPYHLRIIAVSFV